MNREKIIVKYDRAWVNMRRIAYGYPPRVKRRVFDKWLAVITKCNKRLLALNSQNDLAQTRRAGD